MFKNVFAEIDPESLLRILLSAYSLWSFQEAPLFLHLFEQIVRQCMNVGLSRGVDLSLDSTQIYAYAKTFESSAQTPEFAIARRARNKIETLLSKLRNQVRLRKLPLLSAKSRRPVPSGGNGPKHKKLVRFINQSKGRDQRWSEVAIAQQPSTIRNTPTFFYLEPKSFQQHRRPLHNARVRSRGPVIVEKGCGIESRYPRVSCLREQGVRQLNEWIVNTPHYNAGDRGGYEHRYR